MMNPAPISSPEEYLDLVGKFNRKGSLSNNYLQSSFAKLIEDKELFKIEGENNLFINPGQQCLSRNDKHENDKGWRVKPKGS